MPIKDTDLNEIQAKMSPLFGQQAWGVALGEGSFITLEFGASRPTTRPRERQHGEWHLWVYCCAWRLDENDDVIAASEDARTKLEAAVQRLNGLTLRAVDIRSPAFETMLTFDKGITLHLFPVFSELYEHWMLYTPDGSVLTIGPGTSWSYERSPN
jgi:hypothetical protein